MEIIDYCIVMNSSTVKLREEIKRLISIGWQPYGSMSIVNDAEMDECGFCQPMVKYKEE